MHCEAFYDQSGIGQRVHNQILREYPEGLLEDYIRLSELVVELVSSLEERIHIQVIDPQSFLGFVKSLRYWVRKYPTFVVDGQVKISGFDKAKLEQALQERLAIQ
jgi:hypothetical protein